MRVEEGRRYFLLPEQEKSPVGPALPFYAPCQKHTLLAHWVPALLPWQEYEKARIPVYFLICKMGLGIASGSDGSKEVSARNGALRARPMPAGHLTGINLPQHSWTTWVLQIRLNLSRVPGPISVSK